MGIGITEWFQKVARMDAIPIRMISHTPHGHTIIEKLSEHLSFWVSFLGFQTKLRHRSVTPYCSKGRGGWDFPHKSFNEAPQTGYPRIVEFEMFVVFLSTSRIADIIWHNFYWKNIIWPGGKHHISRFTISGEFRQDLGEFRQDFARPP